ncbi:hypothetical protein ACFOZ7_17550 [Natribaculum luteum]|uniref:HEAT repeat domain-containing protein n=1 Tax=Natribaculum luteum TaxID=1586232 RepID=A0ABD5P3W2_9EURY|nr:hypothetical protein [Natribaculum luteum]
MSRAVRRELRTIDDRLSERGDGQFTDDELQVISGALTDSDPRTQGRAITLLDDEDVDESSLPLERLKPDLASVIKTGIDADDVRPKRNAERATRVLTSGDGDDHELVADLSHLGESMLQVADPRLRTGGATLLAPVTTFGEYIPGADEVEAMADHVALSVTYLDGFERQIDAIAPASLTLAHAPEEHMDLIPPRLEPIDLGPFLTGPHAKGRTMVAELLRSLAGSEPEVVSDYTLELTTRLDDEEPLVAQLASVALVELADETENDALRPAVHVLPSALDHDEERIIEAAFRVADAIADAIPRELDRLPIERVEAIARETDPKTKPQLRARSVRVIGARATATESAALAESATSIAYETLTAADPTDLLASLVPLQNGLRDALLAAPTDAAGAIPTDASWPQVADLGPELPLVQMREIIEDSEPDLLGVDAPDPSTSDDDRSSPTPALLTYWTTGYAVREAIVTDETVLDAVAAFVTDGEQPTPRRRLLAGALGVLQVLERTEETTLDRIRSVGDELEEADDDSLSRVGVTLSAN